MKILGLDPGTGVSSPTAAALIDTETNEIINYWIIQPDIKKLNHQQRIAYIAQEVQYIIYSEQPDKIFVETFVMQGRGGMLLHQLIGALMAAAGYKGASERFGTVFNTTVKRLVAGNGGADKREVAKGVADQLHKSGEIIYGLVLENNFDVTDAAAIAIAGILQDTEQEAELERKLTTQKQSKKGIPKSKRARKIKKSNRRSNRKLRRRRSVKRKVHLFLSKK